MLRPLLLTFLIFCCFSVSAQSGQFLVRTGDANKPCDSLLKEIQFFAVKGNTDSLILRSSFFECELRFFIDSPDSVFRIKIVSENGDEGQLDFKRTIFSDSLIDLGRIELKKSTRQLDEFTVTGIKRSFIKIEADKKTITVKDNPILTTSSVYDAILKIPGVVPFPGGGFAVNGKLASVYFENVPSTLANDDLLNVLKSLPATSVETIEIISNPGASYDANLNGAIINIISMAKVSGYISGTVTLNYGLNQNNKLLPSLVLSGKNNRFSWQMQTGYSYFERSYENHYSRVFNSFEPDAIISTDRTEENKSGFFYFKPSVNYKINSKSSLIFNYNLSFNNADNKGASVTTSEQIIPEVSASTNYGNRSKGNNNEVVLKYRTNLDTLNRVFSATANYAQYNGQNLNKTTQEQNSFESYSLLNSKLNIQRFYVRADLELPFIKIDFYLNSGIKLSNIFVSNTGRYNLQNPSPEIFDNPKYLYQIDFDYDENNLAAYVDMKKGLGKKITLGAGVRAENFTLNRRSNLSSNLRSNYFNFFPSANAIYRVFPDINLIATYSRKISIPSYSQFDPNNSGYYDSYNSSVGNVLLKANFFDNYELKATVFDYLEVSMNYSHSQSLNLNQTIAVPNSLSTIQTFETYKNVNVLTHFFAVPVPFRFFIKGMAFFEEPLDIDKLNFLYLYAERIKTSVGGLELQFENKPMWNYGVYSQFILPWKVRMNIDGWLGSKGTYQIYDFTNQRSGVELVLTRDFYNKKLRTSISFQDIFNKTQNTIRTSFPNIDLNNYSKDDTRIIWFKVSYSFGKFEKPEDDGPRIGKGAPVEPAE